jgi:hypothetical protein
MLLIGRGRRGGLNKRRILFGVKAGWNEAIASVLDAARFDCDVLPLERAAGRYDAVLPLNLEQQSIVRADPRAFGWRFLVPGAETEALCHDKLRFNRFLNGSGLGDHSPRTWRSRDATPPFVLKRRRDEFGARSHVIADRAGLAAVAPLLDDPAYFAQALVEGVEEHTTHILAVNGVVLYQLHIAYEMSGAACIRGVRDKPLCSRVLPEAPAAGLVEGIAERLRYTGFGCLNYKIAPGGPAQIFEFNPRFGSSLTRDVNRALDAYVEALDARADEVSELFETAV